MKNLIKTFGRGLKRFNDWVLSINTGTLLVAILTFIVGWQLGHRDVQINFNNARPNVTFENQQAPKNVNVDFKLFWDTWDLVNRQYLDKKALDPNKMFYGAIQGMVAAIGDPYTVFLPPEQQQASKEELSGTFEGVGIQLGFNKDKRMVVIAPLSGTPADKAGIKAGDIIVKIDNKDTANMTLPEAVKLIRGPRGTQISLTIYHDGDTDTKQVTLTRDDILVKSVQLSYKTTQSGKKIAYIQLSRFAEKTENEWQDAVKDIQNQNPQGLILDVRNDPGGLLESAVFVGSEFLDGGNVVLQENAQGERSAYPVNRTGKLLNIPMTVLVNKGSASASEIVAGALQDRGRAKLVGDKTFGKGTIQEAQDLPGGAGIHITVAKWLTPNGRWANESGGFNPDYQVNMDQSDPTKDPQLDRALDLLN